MKKILVFLFFLSQILALNLDFDTLKSDFIQTINSKNSTLSYSGSFIISKDKAYWLYEKPSKKEIYINKNQVIILEHDLEQAILSRLENVPNLTQILKNAKKQGDKFIAKYENTDYTITMQNENIKSVSYKDEFENEVLISLENSIKNPKINDEIFKAKIPPNYDLLR